jgi:hypothetical protein
MTHPRSIAILVHEKENKPFSVNYILWGMCRIWKAQGIHIEIMRGLSKTAPADLVIQHVDLTVLPPDYRAYLDGYARVINRHVHDISKKKISRLLLNPGDDYDGPVIVKTNRNAGGWPEERLLYGSWRSLFRKLKWKTDTLASTDKLKSNDYPIFNSLHEVPSEVFENDALLVERFIPEKEGDLYCLRTYTCFGDQHVNSLRKSTNPIVKAASAVSRVEVPVPEEMVEIRRGLAFDYGKFDYVLHQGKVMLFDANPTPTFVGRYYTEAQRRVVHTLAAGLG